MSKPTRKQKYVNNSSVQVVCRKCKLPFFQMIKFDMPDGSVEYEHANPRIMCVLARAKMINIERAQVAHQAAKKRELDKKKKEAKGG